MKKFFALTLVFMAAALPLCGEITLKLNAGIMYVSLSDVNHVANDTNRIIRKYATDRNGEVQGVNYGLNFNAEVCYSFTPDWSVGLGVGYFKVGPESNLSYAFSNSAPMTHAIKSNISVLPITLTGRWSHALSPSLDLTLGAGLGYYQTGVDFTVNYVWDMGQKDDQQGLDYTFTSSKGGIGFHITAGVDHKLSRNISLTVDGIVRFVSVSDFSGDYTRREWDGQNSASTKGSGHYFWYFEEKIENVNYAQFYFWSSEPSNGQNIRKAEVGLSGFSLTAGIKFYF